MSNVPDAWEDEWSTSADTSSQPQQADLEQKKASTKATKAQRRAQQAEFNRQFWAEAQGPSEPNYFLESRNVVPLRQEFKPPTVLLSRKGPIVQSRTSNAPSEGLQNLSIISKPPESSEDEDEETPETRQAALLKRQAQAAKDREEKQRKYEERRLELFGPQVQSSARPNNRSGNSSPGSNTPPQSRSSTPGIRGRRGRGGAGGNNSRGSAFGAQQQFSQSPNPPSQIQQRNQYQHHIQQQQFRELYDPSYAARPAMDMNIQEAQQNSQADLQPPPTQSYNLTTNSVRTAIHPIRNPRGPDGSGRGGFGFAVRRIDHGPVSPPQIVEPIQSMNSP